jgi:flagellar basal-body rod protein FlgF
MIYGLYLSAQGAQIQSLRQEVTANNLANASTNSFKRDLLRVQAHLPYDRAHGSLGNRSDAFREMTGGTTPADVVTDFSQGELKETASPFDLALLGKGFLQVSNGKQTFLTRDGRLELNTAGQLVTREHGYTLLTANGTPAPALDPSLPIDIRPDGILQQGDAELARLAIVLPTEESELKKVGHNMYTTDGKVRPADVNTQVKQGSLENSGANPMQGMMELIESSRALEANVNMIRQQDEALSRLLQSLPRR